MLLVLFGIWLGGRDKVVMEEPAAALASPTPQETVPPATPDPVPPAAEQPVTPSPTPRVVTAAPPAEPAPTTPTSQSKQWVWVTEFSGSGNKAGPSFHLLGGQQRIRVEVGSLDEECRDDDVSVYIYESGSDVDSAKMDAQAGHTEGYWHLPGGSYYLDVVAIPWCTWSIVLDEER